MCTFTVPSGRGGALFFLRGQMYTSGSTFIKKIESLSFIILVCLGNTSKKKDSCFVIATPNVSF